MNIIQFWVIDYILKQKTTEKFPIRIDEDEEDLYGLVGGLEHNYEEEDGEGLDSHINHHNSRDDPELSHQLLAEEAELEQGDMAPKHRDSEFSQFTSSTSRRL